MIQRAAFHAFASQKALKGAAVWLHAQDGLRIRAGYWPALGDKGRGTIVILPGRSEYIEKYDSPAAVLQAAGWGVVAIDWRGQGLADRLLADPMIGHVAHFADYQKDLDAVMAWLRAEGPALGLSPPFMMLAHSMGGLIGLRGLYRDLRFKAVAFSAPMWGISMPLWRRPVAQILSRSKIALRRDCDYAPTMNGLSYVAHAPFEGNLLTGDFDQWQVFRQHLAAVPKFALGGPSLLWVRQALREARDLLAKPAPKVAMITALGGQERIVLPIPIRKRLDSWPNARLEFYPRAQHEILFEQEPERSSFLQSLLAHYEAAL